jgi:hypothetical protein
MSRPRRGARADRARHPRQTDAQVRLCLACLLARGHLLIEDVPGVGKTTLAHALAKTCWAGMVQRVQFTSDCCRPISSACRSLIAIPGSSSFGADRYSRSCCWPMKSIAPVPKAQSALLEAMEERQVSVDGTTYAAARAVLRRRHAESARADRHLRAARIAARPLPDARAAWAIRLNLGDSGARQLLIKLAPGPRGGTALTIPCRSKSAGAAFTFCRRAFGLMLASVLVAMLIAGLNYNSNLGLAFAFF